MSDPLHFQQSLRAPVGSVFRALTDPRALEVWFSEHASISLADDRYDFWGRFTPETPRREEGRHHIQLVEPDCRLRYTWHLRGAETIVDVRLLEHGGRTVLGLWHHDIPSIPRGEPGWYGMGDVWGLWLEALRRYLDGHPVVRCDFAAVTGGDVSQTVEIGGAAHDVWGALVDPHQLTRWIASRAPAEPIEGGVWMDWADEGALKILELVPERRMSLAWEIDGNPTVVTWTLEESGGKTRLTLAHSGFGADYRTDGELLGWLNYLSHLRSLVEYGRDWLPAVQDVTRDVALYYAATILARQGELLDENDEVWKGG